MGDHGLAKRGIRAHHISPVSPGVRPPETAATPTWVASSTGDVMRINGPRASYSYVICWARAGGDKPKSRRTATSMHAAPQPGGWAIDASERGAEYQMGRIRGELDDRLARTAAGGQAERGCIFVERGCIFGHTRSVAPPPVIVSLGDAASITQASSR